MVIIETMTIFSFKPVGTIHSCYKEKFGIPRQPNLVKAAEAQLQLNQDFSEESVRGLEGFSHIWLSFIFHATQAQGWKPMVRPPRLGGNKKIGVFATRSTFRPNPLGLSVVELVRIEALPRGVILYLRGCDLLDQTPIVDIKPYLPYVDSIPQARSGFAEDDPAPKWQVEFSEQAKSDCQQAQIRLGAEVETVIQQILQLDPRPSYQQGEKTKRVYAMKLFDFDLKWNYLDDNKIKVLELSL
jgi:tRNA-Thr(GGU) m(6)t(6)A37 methyltransferase TsaA